MGLFGGIAGIFGATQEKRAAQEAARIMAVAREDATKEAAKISAEYAPFSKTSLDFFDRAGGYATEDRSLIQQLIAETRTADIGQGFSEADQIALKDAQRLMNENLVGTGNLRSGVAGFYNTELARRAVADVRQRQIGARLNQLSLLFGGASQLQSTTGQTAQFGQAAGNIGVQGRGLAAQLYSSALGLAGGQASAELAKGRALSSQISSAGSALDSGAAAAAAGYSQFGTTTTTPIDVASKYGTEA